jgi:hypothetical protein
VSDRPVHDRLEELFAAEALGGIDDDGRHELRDILTWHDSNCPECARLRSDYSEVAASLALSLEPVPMSSGSEERLMTATRAVAQGRSAPSQPVTRLDDARADRDEERRRPLRVIGAIVGIAACLLGAVVLGYQLRSPTMSPDEIATTFSAQSGTRSASMHAGDTSLVVYYRPGQQAALLVGTGLDDPPSGHVYELWYMPEGKTDMAPGGIFTPMGGTVVAPATVAAPFTTLAVSIEPGYMTSPTGKVVLTTPSG